MDFYNLDMIISVGYRINSIKGTEFRIWATKVLEDHIVRGFSLNKKRLFETNLKDFERSVSLIKKTIETKQLSNRETDGLLKVITDYSYSWILLQKYDQGKLKIQKTTKQKYLFSYEETDQAIEELKSNLIKKKEATRLFGTEREKAFQAIIGNINQTFDKKELYKGIEEKAAHLLYFVIKDHPSTYIPSSK